MKNISYVDREPLKEQALYFIGVSKTESYN